MKAELFKFLLFFVIAHFSYAQKNYWNPVSYADVKLDEDNMIKQNFTVKGEEYFNLDILGLTEALSNAPNRIESNSSTAFLEIPVADGKFEVFEMFQVNTMSPQLGVNFPTIKSYVGQSRSNRSGSLLRITLTPQGFFAMILTPDIGQIFINPIDKLGQYYMLLKKQNATSNSLKVCDVVDDNDFLEEIQQGFTNETLQVNDSTLRTYRLALACTGEYAQFHINQAGVGGGTPTQQINAVLAAMVVAIDRVNSIYERDLAVSLQLIPNNDQLIYLNGSTDPYTNNNGGAMLNQNQNVVNSTIGFSNYDIGHVFSTGGGGIAALGSVCTSIKALGVTGLSSPIGDPFTVDYVCHEMGHQFGANHTQNNNCQRNGATSVETGSGSTIMGYAGICPPNVQSNSDAHFHQVSLNEMFNFISNSSGASCGNFTSLSNTPPTISPVPNYVIPFGTAFYLDASATDAEGDVLTYNWEQLNNQVSTQPPLPNSTQGPNFRSLPSSTESRRYFPNFQDVLNNNLTPTWEVIPFVSRAMNFVVTVRDNNILGGQSSRDFSSITFANVGPFQVTSQDMPNITWQQGETRTITWDVAGTTANGINTANVNILLSTDNGQTFSPLVSNTPNDGIHDIVVSDVQGALCRIMVEAVDNIFYALNSTPFAINSNVTTTCDDFANTTSVTIPDGTGPNQQGPVATSVINIPNNISSIQDVSVTLDVSHTYIQDTVFQLSSPTGDTASLWVRNCDDENSFLITFNDNGATLPANGADCGPNGGAGPTGTFAPADQNDDLMTVFSNGTAGNWTLEFADFYNGDTGTLNSWEIEICSTSFSVDDNQQANFSIFPNPNDGVFTINLSNALSANAQLRVFDIQGRLIETLKFSNSSLSQEVVLEKSYQRGVYLVELEDNGNRSVNKLIIK